MDGTTYVAEGNTYGSEKIWNSGNPGLVSRTLIAPRSSALHMLMTVFKLPLSAFEGVSADGA